MPRFLQHLPGAEQIVMVLLTQELRRASGSVPNSVWTEDLPSEQKGKRVSDSRPQSLRHSDGCYLNY